MKKPVSAPDRRRTRTRHRTVIASALSVSAVAGSCLSYLLLTKDDSDAVSVDVAAYYQFVSARSGNALDVAGADDANGVYSADSGASWKPFAGAPVSAASGGSVTVAADGGTVVWTASGQLPYVSTDQGKTWQASSGLPSGATVVADRATVDTFYALSRGTLFASTDGGRTFTVRATGLANGRIESAPGTTGDLWLTHGGGIVHSTDGGASFTKLANVPGADGIGFGKAAPGARYLALYIVGTVNSVSGIFRSIDGGTAWTRINDDQHQFGDFGGSVIIGDPDAYGRVYVGTNGCGVLIGEPS